MRYGVSGTSSIPSLMGPTQQLARQAGPPGVMPGPGGPGPGPVLGPTGPGPIGPPQMGPPGAGPGMPVDPRDPRPPQEPIRQQLLGRLQTFSPPELQMLDSIITPMAAPILIKLLPELTDVIGEILKSNMQQAQGGPMPGPSGPMPGGPMPGPRGPMPGPRGPGGPMPIEPQPGALGGLV